jgi:hypothetical protein
VDALVGASRRVTRVGLGSGERVPRATAMLNRVRNVGVSTLGIGSCA